ncbi:MAG: VPLPA-CTERM sorting domain-containing protein [Gammaproteobacteria bacterium]|nr:VPLPA-CTERM sorting domain-containing protein [Gammaproteobacteria bacterium]
MNSRVLAICLVCVALVAAMPLTASAVVLTTYSISFDEESALICLEGDCEFPDTPPIMNLAILERFAGEGQSATPWGAFGNDVSTEPGVTTDIVSSSSPFQNAPSQALLIGWLENLPTDPFSQEGIGHVVIGMNNAAAINIDDVPFASIFPGVLQENLIQGLEELEQGGPVGSAAASTLFDFFNNAATSGNLGPNGTPGSALFTPMDGGNFTMVVFSQAQTIGTGTISVVPVPAGIWLLSSALAMLGAAIRRRAV